MLLTFLGDFAGIRGGNLLMMAGLSLLLLLLFLGILLLLIFGMNFAATLFLKEVLLLSAISTSYPDL